MTEKKNSMTGYASMVLAVLWAWVQSFLTRIANDLWDDLFVYMVAAARVAQDKWTAQGMGAVKRDWFIKTVMEHVESRTKLNLIQRTLLRMFVARMATELLNEFNGFMGHDWGAVVIKVEAELAAKLPIIKEDGIPTATDSPAPPVITHFGVSFDDKTTAEHPAPPYNVITTDPPHDAEPTLEIKSE